MADRRETAAGDAAKLREALKTIYDAIVVDGCTAKMSLSLFDINNIAKSVLEAPPRNCDVGTVEEQEERFNAFCERMGQCKRCRDCTSLDGRGTNDPWRCLIEWMQMPYEAKKEGGNNGSK